MTPSLQRALNHLFDALAHVALVSERTRDMIHAAIDRYIVLFLQTVR